MISDFLKTERSIGDLTIALEVLREFKGGESQEEWLLAPFMAWIKLEQFEEYLAYLVNGDPLEPDTVAHLKGRK